MTPYDDPHTACECGHERVWHVDDPGDDGFTGHYCEYEGCDCVDFCPSGDTDGDDD